MKSGLLLGAAVLITVASSGCGPNVHSLPPTGVGPTTISPLLTPRIGGLWGGDVTLTGIEGGTGPARTAGALACAGREFRAVMGETNYNSLVITHPDPTKSDITARLTSGGPPDASLGPTGTGLACSYTGTLGVNNHFVLDSTSGSCTQALTFRCSELSAAGEIVERVVSLSLVGSSIAGTYDGAFNVTAIRGTMSHTYNVDSTFGDNQAQGLVANHTFPSFSRR